MRVNAREQFGILTTVASSGAAALWHANSVDLAATTLVANDCEQRASAFAKVK